ncbi:MAG: HNH endonuclease [Cenarchaeum sp. SB0661_bin_35]|nr:HNH endonuclease [Cenarchaeum sp. SB0662_bin_33]MYC79374.1 HNH endonuclease [Cenarchaeum sp. SB0661_bin_35]MYG32751.1 HNH endonuclease [Cenarchaeum sp. SB0677_bin_16]MYI51920.1 HNH endonuclease [Cenarchaeum sp. SB0673_bin_9]
MKPLSKGGTDHIDNLQLLCGACNSLKDNRDMPYLLAALKRPIR